MAIQFCCSQCGQPIEVDDEHAGRAAACPYCKHVIAVPPGSTFQPRVAPLARALGNTATPGDQDAAPLAPQRDTPALARQRQGLKYASYAFTCTGVAVTIFLVLACYGLFTGAQLAAPSTGRQATFRQLIDDLQKSPQQPWLTAAQLAMFVCAIVGAVLAAVSLVFKRDANWRAWVALIVCGGMVLCVCGLSVMLGALLAGGGFPGG